jgi:hypothetical protein
VSFVDSLSALNKFAQTHFSVKNVKCYPVPDELNPCEDVMGSNWLRGSVWVVVSLTVIGNVCVLVVLFSNRSELTVPKFLMCNLALADFCMGMYLLFIASIDLHSMGEYFNYAFDWQYGEYSLISLSSLFINPILLLQHQELAVKPQDFSPFSLDTCQFSLSPL